MRPGLSTTSKNRPCQQNIKPDAGYLQNHTRGLTLSRVCPMQNGRCDHISCRPQAPGAGRHEAEHSSPAALAAGRRGLRALGTNSPSAASAPQPRGCSPAGERARHGLSQCPNVQQDPVPSAVASTGRFAGS